MWLQWLRAKLVYYPTLFWNVLLGRILKKRRWWDSIDDHVIVGALPFRRDVTQLVQLGVTGVVNTCQEYAGPAREYSSSRIEQLWIPTIDFTHPTLEHVERAVEFIQQHADQGGKVYVHCKAGRARSGTVVVCWLIHSEGIDRDAAQLRLLQKRPHSNPRIAQRPVVIEFEEKHRKRKQNAMREA